MFRFTGPRPATAAALALLGWWAASSPPDAQAATEELLAAAAACAQIDWRDHAGAERARTYRQAVACLKRLYVRIARGPNAHPAFDIELTNRLDALETAYRASRDTCRLRERLGLGDRSCGTIGLAPREFVVLLKTMILDQDAGWVRPDPALARALRLGE